MAAQSVKYPWACSKARNPARYDDHEKAVAWVAVKELKLSYHSGTCGKKKKGLPQLSKEN